MKKRFVNTSVSIATIAACTMLLLLFIFLALPDVPWTVLLAEIFPLLFLLLSLPNPLLAVFDDRSISVRFAFGFYEEIEWEDIEDVSLTKANRAGYYRIIEKTSGKTAFFTSVKKLKTPQCQAILAEHLKDRFLIS